MSVKSPHELTRLHRELVELFEHIQRIRREIAAIRRPGATEDHFENMADQLDAIVAATESATETIMENAEAIEADITEALGSLPDGPARTRLAGIPTRTASIFEACAFQDITGQRVTKVVDTLRFVEDRVNGLISMWGPSEISHEAPAASQPEDEYKRYLHGPALAGEGASQAEIDALFGDAGGDAPPSHEAIAPDPTPPRPKPTRSAGSNATAGTQGTDGRAPGGGTGLDQSDIDALFE